MQPTLGVQLFTLREHTRDLASLTATLRRVSEMGYRSVQASAVGPIPDSEVAEAAAAHGLVIGATHIGFDALLNRTDEVIAKHQTLGCPHVAVGGLGPEYYTIEGIERLRQELAGVMPKMRAAGLSFSYHNHNHEFVRIDGRTWMDRCLESIPARDLQMELDVYWITAGGGDPAAWIRKTGPRQPVTHWKDMAIADKREQRFAPIGEGNLNWDAILEATLLVGTEFIFVEQDNTYGEDPFACLERSYRFCSRLGVY